ncbi:MAG: DUF1648 domain-containing protein [Opitutaceae bacterium]|nr:DUF1648 domain-containing protein [Opitutaceae bacterium]
MRAGFQAVFLGLLALALAQAFWQHARRPERIASHFDAAGQADRWTTRPARTAWQAAIVALTAALVQGLVWFNRRVPDRHSRLPHRDYWLAPARRAATQDRLDAAFLAAGACLMLFFLGLFHEVHRADLAGSAVRTSRAAPLLAGLLAAIATVAALTLLPLNKPPDNGR